MCEFRINESLYTSSSMNVVFVSTEHLSVTCFDVHSHPSERTISRKSLRIGQYSFTFRRRCRVRFLTQKLSSCVPFEILTAVAMNVSATCNTLGFCLVDTFLRTTRCFTSDDDDTRNYIPGLWSCNISAR
jgi:hypothetical protein